jgi:zinc transport system substrate-binding protein
MLKATSWLLLAALGLLAAGCGNGSAPSPDGKPGKLKVFVSILPLAYFVERVGGQRVEVDVLVRPGQSPATYSPTPGQMAKLGGARALFVVGVPFEAALLPRIRSNMKRLRIVDTRKGIKLREADGDADHDHGKHDPHVWLSPPLARQQVTTIAAALSALDPAGKDEYERNRARFAGELDALHAELSAALAPLKGKEIFVFHPSYGYFCAAYGLKQVAVEFEGKSPSPRHLAELIKEARKRGVKVIFAQPQFSQKSAGTVAKAIGGAVVIMDPLARDYMKNMRDMAASVKKALK